MFDIQDRSWIAKSVMATTSDAEITFCLSPTYQPDPYSLDDAGAIALPTPAKMSAELNCLASKDVLANDHELVEHYKAVLQLAHEFGHSYNEFEHHFWLTLVIEWHRGAINFWYTTLDRMTLLFDWLLEAPDGDLWSDVAQGWELIVVRIGDRFHFRQGGFDQGGEYANMAFRREELLASIAVLRDRMVHIVAELTTELGEDYWTRYRYDLRTDLT